jgi:riboflavin kinase / FMN adenylyltransferase
MKVFHAIAASGRLSGHALCLGNFDGVHLGHKALFREAALWGIPSVLTFEPHPGKVLQPDLAPKLITLLPRKLELLEAAGVQVAVVQPFSPAYAHTTASEFESSLLETLGVRHLVAGWDFTYGQARGGDVDSLTQASRAAGGDLHAVPPVTVDGVVVSSSKIREYILEGRVSAAKRLLGRWFDLDGQVVPGAGRGKGIGFPTANVDTPNELRPGSGVYAVRVHLAGETKGRAGAANIGVKPTFGGTQVTIEVHLLDFSGDLYGRHLRIQFIERLRGEERFPSVRELTAQIQRDVQQARDAVARAE